MKSLRVLLREKYYLKSSGTLYLLLLIEGPVKSRLFFCANYGKSEFNKVAHFEGFSSILLETHILRIRISE